jgi:hypothetical protein
MEAYDYDHDDVNNAILCVWKEARGDGHVRKVGHCSATGSTKKAGGLKGGSMMAPRFARLHSPNRSCPSHELRDPQVA